MRRLSVWLASLAALTTNQTSRAESLWDRRDPRSAYLFVDNRARQIGDVLTVAVNEITNIDFKDRRDNEKDAKTNATFSFIGNTAGNSSKRNASASMNEQSEGIRNLLSKAEYTSQRKTIDRMSVTVIDIQPNGNLVIEGIRRRVIQGEEKTLRISGIVRPQDIGANNIVDSAYIADFQFLYHGKGMETSYINNGWFGKIMNKLYPY